MTKTADDKGMECFTNLFNIIIGYCTSRLTGTQQWSPFIQREEQSIKYSFFRATKLR